MSQLCFFPKTILSCIEVLVDVNRVCPGGPKLPGELIVSESPETDGSSFRPWLKRKWGWLQKPTPSKETDRQVVKKVIRKESKDSLNPV
ncbi:hypothetical protein JTE90_016863 [Oedothorax gibbosus]|uniref:Uncharacterized protein n=1 Tax=Oedothorax gibbosus TaxID=931172 RepID=A0AAV6VZ21_9ARAC|nr:hypothetical protein JTE90_016863 [Oedothorax gibbosus]